MTLSVNEICKSFGDKLVLDRFSCDFTYGFNLLEGSSGIGKTTLLRIIAGLEKADSGSISGLIGTPVMMFQEDRLLPWCSALENVFCPFGKSEKAAASGLLSELFLNEEDQQKLPSELSGGMRRRVSLARTLLFTERRGGNVVLLDEPFKGLDPETRKAVFSVCRSHLYGKIVIIVSHEISDEENGMRKVSIGH